MNIAGMRRTAANRTVLIALKTLFGVLVTCLCLLPTLVAGMHQAAAQDGDFSLTAMVDEIDGDKVIVTVRIDPRATSLGALEGSVTFDPAIVSPSSCEFVGELGACNPLDDSLRFSALFIEGLREPGPLLTVTFTSITTETATTVDFADIAGFDEAAMPVAVATAPASFVSGADSSNPLFVALPIIAVVSVLAIGALWAQKRRR